MNRAIVLLLSCVAVPVLAEPITLRMATQAPDGTGWARTLRSFTQDVERISGGSLKVKMYFNGVAGDEMEEGERIRKGQLDGAASGHMLCERVAPSMRVLRLPGVFQSRDEATDVMNRLQPTLEKEAAKQGMVLTATTGLGPDVIFTREPVRTLAELRKVKLWRWELDEVGIATGRAMGLQIVPLALADAARMFDHGQLDGYLAIPAAALAFQWSTQAQVVTDLRSSYLYGCLIFSERAFHALTIEQQNALRTASAQIRVRFDDVGRRIDEQLLGGAFQKQGVRVAPVSASFRADYFNAARAARATVLDKLVPRELVDRVLGMLADYRAEHQK
jgi:TRAP-type C4-dicarboxylate transport system substrate-binding protein